MNNIVQHKLLELEILPPLQVWQLVEEELNAASDDKAWKSNLDQLEIEAPSIAWNHIAAALEPVPEMDFISKLREAAVVPPLAIWNRIEKSLSPSVLKRGWIRYAAAAVMAGLLFSTAYFLPFSSNEKLASAKNEKTGSPVTISKDSKTNDLPVIDQDQINERALEQSKHTYASVDIDRKKISRIASGYKFSSTDDIIEPNDAVTADINDRYIVLMTPDGNFIRVSKKLGNLVCCVSGEEVDLSCKDQVVKWQKQIACADLLHSGNFGDILSLVSELQENK